MKKLMLICAPVTSRSGYGDHARDLVFSFLKNENFDIKIMDVPWGATPRNALNENNENDKKMLDCIMLDGKLEKQPDVYVDIRIPNEFQTHGKINIGITAGVETTAVSQNWLEGCNKMDLVIVPSEHSKMGFVNSKYDKLQQLPNGQQQKVGELALLKPIEVLFEGADEDIYKPLKKDDLNSEFSNFIDNKVTEDFAFLQVGLWGKGGYGEDRKDIGKLIKVFYETFSNQKEQPALILKTSGATFSVIDHDDCLKKINTVKTLFPKDWKFPNVYLLHGNLTDVEMNELYNHPKVKGMVTFTHGEGFGRPLLEASMTGLPIIASNWSGQCDFLDIKRCLMINGKIEQIPKSQIWKDILIDQSAWFNIDENAASKAMVHLKNNYSQVKKDANDLMKINRGKFTLNKMEKKLNSIVNELTENSPTQVGIQLPKLKKVEDNKVKLPKLKKMTETV